MSNFFYDLFVNLRYAFIFSFYCITNFWFWAKKL